MTIAVALKVPEVNKDDYEVHNKFLRNGMDRQIIGATILHNHLTIDEVVVVFSSWIWVCIGLLGTMLVGITLNSWGENTDPHAGHDEQGAAVMVGAEEPTWADTELTATSWPRHEGSECIPRLHSIVGEPLVTRHPGFLLPLFTPFYNCIG